MQREECQNVSAQFPNRTTRLRKDVRPPWIAEVAENLNSRGEKLIQNANSKQKSAASERTVSKCSAKLPTEIREYEKMSKMPNLRVFENSNRWRYLKTLQAFGTLMPSRQLSERNGWDFSLVDASTELSVSRQGWFSLCLLIRSDFGATATILITRWVAN